ncbi:MAG TPA: NAD(P)H-dependent glycerol-3-phosphate dehydrogenase [Candidatus Kapabacteria bacterium]|nr:NAD(P)H-dependent glycerol-3-phosphate dehydrogenase [Candidatus Kapabacteria bacterium]HPO63007.1 NAD(P)H-dependent glycerol-3-phosphate dehydrogenase [Candidatus Kapabacteria bacterium]
MNIAVLGAGGWGTAIAALLSENNHNVTLWAFEDDVVNEINIEHTNKRFLPQKDIPQSIKATNDLNEIEKNEFIVLAIPTQHIRSVVSKINLKNKIIINLAKGIEQKSLLRVSELLIQSTGISPEQYTIITGPSHAEEVAKQIPTTVVAASEHNQYEKQIVDIFTTSYFRIYSSLDVVGCEIGGSLKNVIAIAAGIIDGLNFGDNTKAALITRGLAEISRLGIALGANPITFSGLSGLGDLYVTCSSKHSRNRFVGEQIGKGKTLSEITSQMKMIAEGVSTAESAFSLSQKHNVEMPITEQVYNILFNGLDPLEAIQMLMTRQSKREWWW